MAQFPSDTTADGVWTLKQQRRAVLGDDWPEVVIPSSDNSVTFDGAGDYLKTNSSSDFAFGTGDFTMEAWVYGTVGGTQGIVSTRIDAGGGTGQIFFGLSGTSVLYYAGLAISGGTVTEDTWHHIACSRSGSTVRVFLDGTQVGTGTDSNTKSTTLGYIGAGGGDGSQLYTGTISNARFVKGTAIYTSSFTVPTSNLTAVTNTVLLTCQEDFLFTDNSGTSKTITTNGDPAASALSPF